MTQRDEVGGPFRRLDRSDARNRQRLAFREVASIEPLERLWGQLDEPARRRHALRDRFVRNVDHLRRPVGCEVCQVAHVGSRTSTPFM